MLFHFRLQEDHRPKTFSNKRKTTAKEAVDNLLSGIAQHTRSARVKEVVNRFSDEEVELYLLPRVAASVKASKYIQKQSENGAGNIDKARVLGILDETVKVLSNPESFVSNNVQQTVDIISLTMENVKKLIQWKPQLVSTAIMEDELVFKNFLMPMVYTKYEQDFIDFACGISVSLNISHAKMQDVLRNTWGKKLSRNVLGVNIIPPKEKIIKRNEEHRKKLGETVGITFNEHQNTVFATVNIQKYLQYLLSQPQFDLQTLAPCDKILVYQFTDLAPFLRWSWHCNALSSCRLKVVDLQNLHSLLITIGAYLGPDSYDMLKAGFKGIYDQLSTLKPLTINGKNIDLITRSCADGKQRRLDTGSNTAKSSYCLVEAPEHKSQLGDMTIVCESPVWSVQDTRESEEEYKEWLGSRKDNNKNRKDFASSHMGNVGEPIL